MPELTLQQWERGFRRDAKADELAIFRNHLRKFNMLGKPELMLKGTIHVVHACSAYLKIDGRPIALFLEMQKYNPSLHGIAEYTFTFDLYGKAYARVLAKAGFNMLDLADLYNHPWQEYRRCGYSCFWITRTDGTALTTVESKRLEKEVMDDLFFDYSKDELDVWFDDSLISGALFVNVQDVIIDS